MTTTATTIETFKKAVFSGKTGVPEWLAHVAQAQRESCDRVAKFMGPYREKVAKFEHAKEVVERANGLIQAGSPHSNDFGGSSSDPALVREGNELLNDLAAEVGSEYVRALDNMSLASTLHYVDHPGSVPPSLGGPGEGRTYRAAFDQILQEAVVNTETEVREEAKRQQREAPAVAA